ncbi:MAG TPA: 2-dehydropantoate 2-reductase [Steroidobacteraceae bacterium]|jgi:2-dehydropantoate 2-reductase
MSDSATLIVGAGAMGGTIGAHLVRSGHKVIFMDRARDHVSRMRESGLEIAGPLAQFRVPVSAAFPEDLDGEYGRVLLCVKAQDTEAATRLIAPHLAADGYIVSVQNGLNELDIASIVGAGRTVGCFVNFGADYLSPGVVQYAGRGAVVLGEIGGAISERLLALLPLFRAFDERAMLTGNIWGFLWSKEAYGALLFATALTNESIADCLALPRYRQLFVSLAREVLGVAATKGIACEPFDGFQPVAFSGDSTDEEAARSLDLLVEHNRRSVKTHSGIWRDLAVRKRRTEVDAQLGAVVREAAACGVRTPITVRLIELIHEIENGVRPLGLDSLDALTDMA